jgi:peptidoglycan/LPS O-acetylase OafA/YrhL
MKASARIPSLDGLRAISITLVLIAHLTGTRGYPFHTTGPFALGELGVRVFFVISGYLITSILLAEQRKRGRISLAKFYFRRVLRLFPAFYTYIAVVVALSAMGLAALRPWDVTCALGYAMNYHRDRGWVFGHCWSLSVEEQFYFIWPVTLGALGAKRGLRLAAACVLLAPVVRVAEWHFFPEWRDGIGETFPTIADAIGSGCVLAGVRTWLHEQPSYGAFQRSWAFVLVPCVVVFANAMESHPSIDLLVGQTVMNLGIALCVDWCMRYDETWVGRVLNARPLVVVGVGSYSIYLWQQLFLDRHSDAWPCAFPVNVALVAVVATASYRLVEKPLLTLRERWEPRVFGGAAVPKAETGQ